MTSVKQGSTDVAQFGYDALNRRVSRQIGSGPVTQFLYDKQNIVEEDVNSQTTPVLTGFGLDERFARSESSGRMYFLTDVRNSTVALFNSTGSLVQSYSYEPYGEVAASGSSSNPYQFIGRENDGEGLYYFRARYFHHH